MVNTLDLTTIIIQIPEAQRLHHAQLIHPEVHQAMALDLAQRKQRLEKKQVSKSRATETKAAVTAEKEQLADQAPPADKRHNLHEKTEVETDQGHLIDMQA